jgi:hypothetical protein
LVNFRKKQRPSSQFRITGPAKNIDFADDDWANGALSFRPNNKFSDFQWEQIQKIEKKHFKSFFEESMITPCPSHKPRPILNNPPFITQTLSKEKWRAQRDSNPQPTDLESAALPLELYTQMPALYIPKENSKSYTNLSQSGLKYFTNEALGKASSRAYYLKHFGENVAACFHQNFSHLFLGC